MARQGYAAGNQILSHAKTLYTDLTNGTYGYIMIAVNTLRLSLTDDLNSGLELLLSAEYPTLTKAEVAKVAIGREVVRVRRKLTGQAVYDDSEVTPRELMLQASRVFGVTKDDSEPVNYDLKKLKPVNWNDHA